MAITTPKGEQIQFVSAKTGTHSLDTYLEAAEVGNRQLHDLLDDLFDSSTGVFKADNFQFRFDTSTDKLQVRVGQFANSTASWTDVTTFFKVTGTFSTSTSYNNFDLVTLSTKDVYIVHGLTSATAYSSESNFISSANTSKIVDVSEARDWASKTDGQVSSTDYSSKAWAIGGTGVTDTASKGAAKEWATKTSGTVDGSDYSAKYWATTGTVATVSGAISNVNTVAGISAGVTTVAGISSSVTALADTDVLADMALLAIADVISDMNVLAIPDVISDLNTLATADIVDDMNVLGTATNVTNMGTLAGISSDITTVAGKASLITSDFVSDLNALAVTDVINDINLLADAEIVSDLNALAVSDIISDLNTLATTDIVSDLNTLATLDIVADLNQLATLDFVSDLNAMATTANINSLNAVNGSISNVNTVAGSVTNVNTTAGSISNVNAVAGSISNVNSLTSVLTGNTTFTVTVANVGGQNVFAIDGVNNPVLALVRGNTYVFNQSDGTNSNHPIAFKDASGNAYTTGVTSSGTAGSSGATVTFAVASDAPSSLRYYCSVHGNAMGNTISASSNNLTVVAGSIGNVNNTGGSISNVNTVGGSISNVNTVATNISSVNDFADKYRIGSSDPSSSNDEGDLFYNTTANALKVYTGSAWENGVSAGSGFLQLSGGQLTGNITMSGAQTVDGRNLSVDGLKLDNIAANANNYSLPLATDTSLGGIELFSDTDQTVAANTVTATASRTYGIQLNSDNQAVVNVPWVDTNTDTNTTYSLATSSALGLVKIGYTESGKNYPVELSSEQMFVNVPWTDTVYTLPLASNAAHGGIKLNSDTDQLIAANALSSSAGRTYAVQLNAANQAVVNVPWVDTNTVYSHPTSDGNIHIPSGGSSGQILGYASAGTAQWQAAGGGDADSVDGKSIAVVTALPGSPDANTIYFVTG